MRLKNKKILVTGGSGFIGSSLVGKLVKIGADTAVIDNLKSSNEKNLIEQQDKIDFFQHDIRDLDFLDKFEHFDVVIHLAANASVPYSIEDPYYDFSTNVIGTYNILKKCIDWQVEKIVYASSAAVYGEPNYTPIDEDHPKNPISPYGASKLTGEILGFNYYKVFKVPFTAARIFNVYGIKQKKYVIHDFIRKLRENPNQLTILGNGEQVRTFCNAEDAVDALLLLVNNEGAVGEVYNLGGENPIKIKDLAKKIIEVMDLDSPELIFTEKSWKGDINLLIGDITKLKKIGFKPKINIDEGLKRFYEWYINEYDGS